MKIAIGLILFAFVFVLSCWFFFWPLVECTYAMSWEPLMETSLKMMLFIFGGFVFVVGMIFGIRFII